MPAPIDSLHSAAEDGDLAAIERFLREGMAVDSHDPEGRTPLMYAMHGGQVEAARSLLEADAAIGATTPRGLTPLHFAARRGSADLVQLLLSRGADPNQVVQPEPTVRPALEKLFVGKSRHPTPFRSGERTLNAAVDSGDVDTVRALLDAEVDLIRDDVRNVSGLETPIRLPSPLSEAAAGTSLEIVLLLIERGADVNETEGPLGTTPLRAAVEAGNLEIARALLSSGADPELGILTPVDGAIRHGNAAMLDLLLEFGASARDTKGFPLSLRSDTPLEILRVLERHAGTGAHLSNGGAEDLINAQESPEIVTVLRERGASELDAEGREIYPGAMVLGAHYTPKMTRIPTQIELKKALRARSEARWSGAYGENDLGSFLKKMTKQEKP